MSTDEKFLARWSRRKRGAEAATRTAPAAAKQGAQPASAAAPAADEQTLPAVDLATLPSIEAIDAASDIRAFLAAGVPAELRRAALRRAWSTDPAIRDFIGLAENAWDFTAPGGVPGFGPLTAEDAERLLAQLAYEPAEDEANRPADASASVHPTAPPAIPATGESPSAEAAVPPPPDLAASRSRRSPQRHRKGAPRRNKPRAIA